MAREKKKKLDLSVSADVTLGDLFALDGSGLPEGKVSEPEKKQEHQAAPRRSAGKVVLRRERKGRKGKTVTLVEGVSRCEGELEDLAREMRRDLGCGSHVEGNVVVLQGDQVDRAASWLDKKWVGKVVRGN